MVMQEDPKLISSNRHTKSTTACGKLLSVYSLHTSLSSDEKRTAFRGSEKLRCGLTTNPSPSSTTHSQEGTQKSEASP